MTNTNASATAYGMRGIWRALMERRSSRWSLAALSVFLFFGIFADFIANEKPLYCKIEGKHYFPILQDYTLGFSPGSQPKIFADGNWQELPYQMAIFPMIPYSAGTIDRKNLGYVSPFESQRVASWRYRHWLGTDQIGRDVAAGLIYGARAAMLVGLLSMSVAMAIGVLLGGIAGFFGDHSLKLKLWQLVLLLPALALSIFWAQIPGEDGTGGGLLKTVIWAVAALLVSVILGGYLGRKAEGISIPADFLVMRFIEVMNSIPALLLLICAAALMQKPSLWMVMVIIGLIRWTGIARFIRAELLRIRNLSYIEAARVLGFSEWYILWRHALPNALPPAMIALAFGIAGAILLEAFLSFLGIGVAPDEVTWGAMLQASRSNFRAWWLALSPGLAIFVAVTVFNLLGEALSDALDKR